MADMLLRDTDPADFTEQIAAEFEALLRRVLAESTQPKLVDRNELARLLGVSIQTINRLVKDRMIPSVRIGKRRLFEARKVIDALTDVETDCQLN